MKNKILLLLLFAFGISFGQKISFAYDAAGNQITRIWNITNEGKNSSKPVKPISQLKESDMQQFFPNDVISYYPNPVKDELYLKWKLVDDVTVSSITIYNSTGLVLKTFKDMNSTDNQNISFQDYLQGVYIVQLNYSNDEAKTIKIIKQ